MYNDIPKSCEFGGCKSFEVCREKYKKEKHGNNYISPPFDRSKCTPPCSLCVECFTYMDKYNNSDEIWVDMHGID